MEGFYRLFTYDVPFTACSGDEYSSADEEDSDEEALYITTLEWRAEEVRQFMDTLDDLYLAYRFKNGIHPTSGNFPIPRHVPSKVRIDTRTKVPKGLPRNFYSEKWLEKLEPYERQELEMKEPVELKFPRNIEEWVLVHSTQTCPRALMILPTRLAATAADVIGRSTRPRARNYND